MDSTSILINIRKILRSVNLESKRIQKEYGISIPQLLTLNFLKTCDDFKATHGQISKYLNLNSSTVTGIISRLEKKGYVAKLPNLKDKRITYVALTTNGASLLKKTPELMHEQLQTKLNKLSEDQLKEIERGFKLLIDVMGIDNIDAYPLVTLDDLLPTQGDK
ncbi:MarR family transcriptional regulator [Fulvivirga sp. 29W222]|uniref:HTH-type transcriptional regulator MgrA n=1 Tax=Fulvivirga marina TaxID=2494733 RepID=A0A937KDZ3_9BACT|nr:MarR family transcriptional regulator [Fulvivirga marina]MBL6448984.1 MarR family transcriptional regulator [Fulvivirga marina]